MLDEGWVEGMQVDSIEPAPADEESRDGRLVLSYAALGAGDVLKVWLQFEVNPTNVDELRAEARQQSVGSLDDVRFAVLETSGKVSFITR